MITHKKGSLTVQFLLGTTLVLGFIFLFSLMSLTLAMGSVTQYVTYASSRALFLGHIDKNEQATLAREKYKNLTTNAPFQKLFNLFEIDPWDNLDIQSNTNMGLNQAHFGNADPPLFYGVWTTFKPKLLVVKTMWGSSEEEEDFFTTHIGSYLGHEPTTTDCKEFYKKRFSVILNKHGDTGNLNIDPGSYREESFDNGC